MDFSRISEDEKVNGIKITNVPKYIREKAYLTDFSETLAQLAEMIIQLGVNLSLDPDEALKMVKKLQYLDAQLAQTDYEARRKKDLEDLTPRALAAIEGGEGTSFNLLSIPQDKSVTMDKIAFKKKSTNLYNDETKVEGHYVVRSDGNLAESPSFNASDFIHVEPETTYYLRYVAHYVFYDEDKNLIIGDIPDSDSNHFVTTSPPNAKYLRFSWRTSFTLPQQVNKGSEQLPFEPFYEVIDNKNLEKWEVSTVDVQDGAIKPEKTSFVKSSKNLFNKETILQGYYVNQASGNLEANAGHYSSDFIEVKSGEFYTFSRITSNTRYAFYTRDKEFIEGEVSPDLPIQPPKYANYIRFSQGTQVSSDTLQFEQNTTPTSYEPFGLKMPNLLMDAETIGKDEVLVYLPNEISVAVGRTIELYNKQVVWAGNIENYHIQWVSNIGKAYERKWSFTGEVGNIGTYNLTINVFDNNMNLVTSANTTVKVASNVLSETYNLLPMGDSLTNAKPWLNELESLSNSKIKNIGTRQGGRHEGRSGGSAAWFLNDSTYTFDSNYDGSNPDTDGTENPFWNPTTQKFDFDYYKTTYNKAPDAVQIFLGTNDLALDPTTNADNIKEIVDGIRASDSTIPIFVVNTLYRSGQDGMANQASNDGYSSFRSAWKLEEDRKVFNLMVRLDELLNGYTNVHFVPVALTHDSEYNFGQVEIPVNSRSEITTMIPKESVHPQHEGYMQMADIMFSTMVANLE